jgi:two-component system response regulator HydG
MKDDVLPAKRPEETARTDAPADVVDGRADGHRGALRDCEGSREKAAPTCRISATTLWRKMTGSGLSTTADPERPVRWLANRARDFRGWLAPA